MVEKTEKTCDMNIKFAMQVFEMLNPGKVKAKEEIPHFSGNRIITDVEPKDLIYPEGWYYAKGCFRNKHTTTRTSYHEAIFVKSDGTFWMDEAKYSTLDD